VIPLTALLATTAFGEGLDARKVGALLAEGMLAAEPRLSVDCCPLGERLPADFEQRLSAARAVVIAQPRLDPGALPGSLAFEIATRARQGGVPAYAIAGPAGIDPFEARILDLQVVLLASTPRQLRSRGGELALLL
jgi:glycerate kinase